MLDLVGVEMLQLNLIVVQQPQEEYVGRGCEPTLMEVGKRHYVAVRRLWQILLAGQQPLLGQGPCAKKPTTDEALHALEGDVRMAPRIHLEMGVDGREFNRGKDAEAGNLSDGGGGMATEARMQACV